ncbi:MAG: DUF1476 domain-containing protein [Planctomycetota bacterium]
MSGYDERKQAMETRMAQDSELRFKVTNRRNRLLGDWAAEKLGRKGDEAVAYAKTVVLADFEEPGDADVIRKVAADFAEAGLPVTEQEIRQELARLQPQAQQQVMQET